MRTYCKCDRQNSRHRDWYPSDQKNKHIVDSVPVRSVLDREHDDNLNDHPHRDGADTEVAYASKNLKFSVVGKFRSPHRHFRATNATSNHILVW
jgi:hypothetical protein